MAQTRRSARRPTGAATAARPTTAPTPDREPPVCTVTFCPICAVVTTAGELRPEFAAHVMAAGRELLLAMRSLIDTRLEGMEQQKPVRLERLTIE
jgi:hypothetical protein